MKRINYIALKILISFCTLAKAEDHLEGEVPVVSWSILGPAFSKHFSTSTAPVVGSTVLNDGGNLMKVGQSTAIVYYTPEGNQHFIQYFAKNGQSANSYCNQFYDDAKAKSGGVYSSGSFVKECVDLFKRPYNVPIRRWNQNNFELGFEEEKKYSDHIEKMFFGAAIDSYYKPSIFIGFARQKNYFDGGRVNIDAGLTIFLWYRTVPDADGILRKILVPGMLPILSITDKKSGVGVNLMFVPAIRFREVQLTVNTLMCQMAWSI